MALAEAIPGRYRIPIAPLNRFRTVLHHFRTVSHHFRIVLHRFGPFRIVSSAERCEKFAKTCEKLAKISRKFAKSAKLKVARFLPIRGSNPRLSPMMTECENWKTNQQAKSAKVLPNLMDFRR